MFRIICWILLLFLFVPIKSQTPVDSDLIDIELILDSFVMSQNKTTDSIKIVLPKAKNEKQVVQTLPKIFITKSDSIRLAKEALVEAAHNPIFLDWVFSTEEVLSQEVIDEETGEVVVEEEFEGETEVTIDQTGSYIVQIYSGNTVMTGEFEVE